MTFEFIITYQPQEDDPIHRILRERLREALETNLNDVEDDDLTRMVQTTFERAHPNADDGTRRAVLGFSLELSDETVSMRDAVDDFTDALTAAPIAHALKCEDPLLRTELISRAQELFDLEMKLRRVLSIIYLHAYPDADPYDLLAEEAAQPMSKEKPQKEQMKTAAENQFFHLTFGQYVGLNQRPVAKDLASLVSLFRNKSTYEAFRDELLRRPVEHEDDAGFLAGLKALMDSVEKMRNAVAHNRRPPKKTNEAYLNALPLVNQALDNFLETLKVYDWQEAEARAAKANEPVEDYRAKEVIKYALENADWDKATQSINLHTKAGPDVSVGSRAELETALRSLCSGEWHNNALKIDGEFVGFCDDSTCVFEALEDYDDRLEEFFAEDKDNEE